MQGAWEITKVTALTGAFCHSLALWPGDNLSPLPAPQHLTGSPLYIWLSGNPGMARAV